MEKATLMLMMIFRAQETSDSTLETSVTSASQSVTSAPSISIAKPLITRPYVTKRTYPAESTNNTIENDRPNLLKSKLKVVLRNFDTLEFKSIKFLIQFLGVNV